MLESLVFIPIYLYVGVTGVTRGHVKLSKRLEIFGNLARWFGAYVILLAPAILFFQIRIGTPQDTWTIYAISEALFLMAAVAVMVVPLSLLAFIQKKMGGNAEAIAAQELAPSSTVQKYISIFGIVLFSFLLVAYLYAYFTATSFGPFVIAVFGSPLLAIALVGLVVSYLVYQRNK